MDLTPQEEVHGKDRNQTEVVAMVVLTIEMEEVKTEEEMIVTGTTIEDSQIKEEVVKAIKEVTEIETLSENNRSNCVYGPIYYYNK